ncbi:NitT/TauT family transport system substrate-binding protein [Devosia crocina]|uniref:NitT/TauT family transport system substrate-binding protein n=2 Tax=Devosia crocina TaxID=429728 RepID=A0A1I7N2Y2_9HYPH|nr:NitT/TauT family transport system substrate-binding protein [Devosia crocina]
MAALGFAHALAEGSLSLTVGVQESGTVQWEIETIKTLGLDGDRDLFLDIRYVADSRAGQIALQTGAVDVILSDFVWVSAQRSLGNMLTLVPHSLTVGGLMVPADSNIETVEDLEGETIGVAGGPADKSWIILQALYESRTGKSLTEDAEARFGAPPLINELLGSGGVAAGLNFWQWNARAKAAEMAEIISVKTMLDELGIAEQPPLLGWTFTEDTASGKTEAITAFLDASFAAKSVLLNEDDVWTGLQELMGAAGDQPLFVQLRDDYREGIVTSYDPDDVSAAAKTFALLGQYGGNDVVGESPHLAPGTFWKGYRK